MIIAEATASARESLKTGATAPIRLSRRVVQVRTNNKPAECHEVVKLSAEVISDRIGSGSISLAELDGRLEAFIRLRRAKLLLPGNHEHDFASWTMRLIVCQEFGSGAATEFLEFLCQFACNAKLAL